MFSEIESVVLFDSRTKGRNAFLSHVRQRGAESPYRAGRVAGVCAKTPPRIIKGETCLDLEITLKNST